MPFYKWINIDPYIEEEPDVKDVCQKIHERKMRRTYKKTYSFWQYPKDNLTLEERAWIKECVLLSIEKIKDKHIKTNMEIIGELFTYMRNEYIYSYTHSVEKRSNLMRNLFEGVGKHFALHLREAMGKEDFNSLVMAIQQKTIQPEGVEALEHFLKNMNNIVSTMGNLTDEAEKVRKDLDTIDASLKESAQP